MSNWNSPGSDQISNYWLKGFLAMHSYIIDAFNKIIENLNKYLNG
jgi:hypothetical protein